MKVYLSVDMEGIAGVVHEDQTNPLDPRCAGEYNRFRRLMTDEASAAVQGALDGGARHVLVNDSHWNMRNLLAEELHPAAELVSGDPKQRSMLEGIEAGFDAAFFVGYHAMAGTPLAVLDHTYTDRIHRVRLNGREVGELGLNAALAGAFGVPVALVTGDEAVTREARALLGDAVTTVAVKQATSRHAARSLAPTEACRRISEAARSAVVSPGNLWLPDGPFEIEVEFALTVHADMAEMVPGSRREGGRIVRYRDPAYPEAYRAFRAMYNLATLGA